MSHGVLSPLVVHNRLPFQPAVGSSMRPSITWTTTTGTYGGAGVKIPEESRCLAAMAGASYNSPMKTLTVRLPAALVADLETESRERHRSKSDI